MTKTTLLRGGTVLLHDEDQHVHSTKADILITGSTITKIAPDLSASDASTTLDCTDKLLTPGFVDTHHHVWQTQLKGQHANHTLLQYFAPGNFSSFFYEPDDVFWGQLAGALEALDAGTTTLLDHSHINYSPEHSYAALTATLVSGIRSVYGYCPTPRAKSFTPFEMDFDIFPAWVMETFDKLAAAAPFADGRVTIGFAFDGLFLPNEVLQPLFKRVVDAGTKVYTIHENAGPSFHNPRSKVSELKDRGLLDPRMKTVLSHGNTVHGHEAADLDRFNVSISNTPTSELHMGMSKLENPMPVALSDEVLAPYCSVGIDCHALVSAFIPGQLRELLGATRMYRHDQIYQQGRWQRALTSTKPGQGFPTAEQAFNLATVAGAKALGMAGKIGQIKEGYVADIVVWDAMSPGMVAAAEEDPVAAVVFHSGQGDVHGVIVDGMVRKWDGKLNEVLVDGRSQPAPLNKYHLPQTGTVSWSELSKEIIRSRKKIQEKRKGVDFKGAEETIMNVFGMAKETMIE